MTWARTAALVFLVVGPTAIPTQSQAPQPVPQAELVPYTDPSFGFELSIPADWGYDRTRFQRFKDSIGLLRGRSAGGRQALQVMVFRSFDMKPFEDWVVDFGKALAELTHSTRIDWQTIQLPPRAGAVLTYTAKAGADASRTRCLCVPFDPQTVWVLIYTGVTLGPEDEQRIDAQFDRIARSLNVLYDPLEAEKLAPALDRGKVLCARLRGEAERVRIEDRRLAYEILENDKPVGYFTRSISREEHVFSRPGARRRYSKDGLRVRERAWRFAEDGTVRFSRLDMFSSIDMRSELIEFEQTQVPAPDVQPQQLFIKTDQVIREDDVLFSSHTTSLDRSLPDPGKPISVGPVYLDLAWTRLLPGLLLGGSQETHAFAVYNTDMRALLAHRITPLGETALRGHTGVAYGFELVDGFIDRPTRLYADRQGDLIRLETGETVLKRVSAEEIERQYGQRRDAARKRFGLPAE